MRKWIALIAVAGLAVAGNGLAQCSSDTDEICIFFSEDCQVCENCLPPGTSGSHAAYVVLMNASEPSGVSGFEFCLCNEDGTPLTPPPNYFVTGYTYPPGAINAATEPCFAVGLAAPLTWSPCITMLTINMLVFGVDCWCFGLEPNVPASIPNQMAYAAGADPGLLLPMIPCTGPENSCAVACVNCPECGPVATEDATWGSVKSLYR
jgi:hypothetical protein